MHFYLRYITLVCLHLTGITFETVMLVTSFLINRLFLDGA